jgi:hypothetical protein
MSPEDADLGVQRNDLSSTGAEGQRELVELSPAAVCEFEPIPVLAELRVLYLAVDDDVYAAHVVARESVQPKGWRSEAWS